MQSISVKLIYRFLKFINGYSFFSYLEKVLKEKEAKIEKELVEVLQKATDLRKKTGK